MTTLNKLHQSERLEKLLDDFSIAHIRKSKTYTLSRTNTGAVIDPQIQGKSEFSEDDPH